MGEIVTGMVPRDAGDQGPSLWWHLLSCQGCFLYFASGLVIGSVPTTPFYPVVFTVLMTTWQKRSTLCSRKHVGVEIKMCFKCCLNRLVALWPEKVIYVFYASSCSVHLFNHIFLVAVLYQHPLVCRKLSLNKARPYHQGKISPRGI